MRMGTHLLGTSLILLAVGVVGTAYCAPPDRRGTVDSSLDPARRSVPRRGVEHTATPEGGVLTRIVRFPRRVLGLERERIRTTIRGRMPVRVEEPHDWVWRAPGGSYWYTAYEPAYLAAARERKMLVVYFAPEQDEWSRQEFERVTLADPNITEWLKRYVAVRIPQSSPHIHGPEFGALLSDPAFVEMKRRPGFAIVDLVGDRPDLFGYVTFVRPFRPNEPCAPFELATILNLPRATLTQRSMIYAVRMHPEQPQSARANASPYLLDQAARQSQYQASIQLQGHHNWDTRFHQISGSLGSVYSAQEVVAESWGWEETILDAAKECVHSWRQSPGHWSAVRAPHTFYGYDMKRGGNGKYYGTGIFGNGPAWNSPVE
jgi:hypothetical protein